MKHTTTITTAQVSHIAELAHIPITQQEAQKLSDAFEETLDTFAVLKSVDTAGVEPTNQVTGLENVLREDIALPEQSFSQQQALANAQRTHKGYFVVKRILAEK